jgi:hypothetical protein
MTLGCSPAEGNSHLPAPSDYAQSAGNRLAMRIEKRSETGVANYGSHGNVNENGKTRPIVRLKPIRTIHSRAMIPRSPLFHRTMPGDPAE